MTTLYVPEHAKNVARGMVKRYGGKQMALEECQRNINSPLTTEPGKKFWTMVRQEIESVVESPTPKYRTTK